MQISADQQKFCGRVFTVGELSLIQEIVETCAGISRLELAQTVCELLGWKRCNGKLKARECRDLLERMEVQGLLKLPKKKPCGSKRARKSYEPAGEGQVHSTLTGSVEQFAPLRVDLAQDQQKRLLFRELMSRYHYLGYALFYGARLQYLVYVSRPRHEVVGCVQFSSPAWRMKARDQWIGWDDARRESALQQVVNNSRFLVLAPIRNLASAMLSRTLERLKIDWERHYAVKPLLVETLVDKKRFHGGCYRAANWIELGETSGRGRMDSAHLRHGAQVKTILVSPLVKHAARCLREGRQGR